jgi:hypothetical protein
LCGNATFGKDLVWQGGTLTDVDTNTSTRPNGWTVEVWRYSIDGGDRTYVAELEHVRGTFTKPPKFEINSPIDFAVDGDHLYIKDAKGKEYKLKVIKQGSKGASK